MKPDYSRAAVIVVSDRGSLGTAEDLSGPLVARALREAGFTVGDIAVVPDGADSVEGALRAALATGVGTVVTSGGTGVGPRDLTPEGTRPVLARELPGVAEELRRQGAGQTPTAVLSRGLAGITDDGVVVVNLPGSPHGAGFGVRVLTPLLSHLTDQLMGGDHS
ncbi:MAG: molybdenum cofactor biosynthesis protein [Actinobacteria bacterium HGW-Actinobacteria-4]|nr:MAG: molybdenum cofactor biosynthesis protein [Actinobacteria bacterium HGW-Actinobacteria-4]